MKPKRKIGYIYDTPIKSDLDPGKGLLAGIAVGLMFYGLLILAL